MNAGLTGTAVLTGVAVLAGVAALAGAFFILLFAHPDPPGVDGYYYLEQVESLARDHAFYFRDWSPAFAPPALLALLGVDALTSLRISLALTWALLVFFGAELAFRLAPERKWRAALFCGAALALCPAGRELVLEYEKNAASLAMLLAAANAWITFRDVYRKPRIGAVLAFGLVATAVVTHKSAFLVVIALALAAAAHRVSSRTLTMRAAAAVAAALLATVALFSLAFDRALAVLTSSARFLASPTDFFAFWARVLPAYPGLAVSLALCVAGVVAYVSERRGRALHALAPGGNAPSAHAPSAHAPSAHAPSAHTPSAHAPSAAAVVDAAVVLAAAAACPVLLAGPAGFTWRITLALPFVFFPVLAARIARLSSLSPSSRPSHASRVMRAPLAIGAVLGALAVPFAIEMRDDEGDGIARHFPRWSRFDDDVADVTRYVDGADLLIAGHGLEFYLAERTGIRARSFVDRKPGQRAFRMAHLGSSIDARGRPYGRNGIDATAREHALMTLGDEYALFDEDDWRALSTTLAPDAMNPTASRPAFVTDY